MAAGPRPTRRSIILLLIPLYNIIVIWQMLNELKALTNNPDFSPIMAFMPCIGPYYLFFKVPAEVASAKQMTGCQVPARGFFMYFMFAPFALMSDLNDMAA
jgi:hypothetical protein